MKIGLIDIDIIEKAPTKALNVELMKTAKYYENNGWEVRILLPDEDIFLYDKIIVFANRRVISPKNKRIYIQHPNIEYYGLVFSNLIYQPINSEELNNCPIETKYYKELLNYLCKKRIYTKGDVEKMLDTNWVRIFTYPNTSINIGQMFDGRRYRIVDSDIFSNTNWREVFLNLSLFGKKISFAQEIKIKKEEDLDNFLLLVSYQFTNLKAEIDIGNIEEYLKFLENKQEKLNQHKAKIIYNLVYNENNIYDGRFLENRIKGIFQLIDKFNKLGIQVSNTIYYPYSEQNFAERLLFTLTSYAITEENNKCNFHKYFIQKNGTSDWLQGHYKHFLNSNQQYFYWFSRNYKIKEVK